QQWPRDPAPIPP
uniref:Bradykinin-potentiating peptide 12a n=1 Tax=Bothrops atrox TaxID=8725 RepID=BPP12_BOTAT|nr:RecName: Full=Bradykinin-potentiating peptide 12a; Short=BPP-12a; AltName: Full=Bradykinin-potentiating peptide BAX12a [Bothrops atrox]